MASQVTWCVKFIVIDQLEKEAIEKSLEKELTKNDTWNNVIDELKTNDKSNDDISIFKKDELNSYVLVDKNETILTPAEEDSSEINIYIHLKDNSPIPLQVFVDQKLNPDWVRMERNVPDVNKLLTKDVIIEIRPDDKFRIIPDKLDVYKERFVWGEGESFVDMNVMFYTFTDYEKMNSENTFREFDSGGCLTADGLEPSQVYLIFGETVIKESFEYPKREFPIFDFPVPKADLEYIEMPIEPADSTVWMKVEVWDGVRPDTSSYTKTFKKTLVTKDYTWRDNVLFPATRYFDAYGKRLYLEFKDTPIDMDQNLWRNIEHLVDKEGNLYEIELQLKEETLFRMSVEVGVVVKNCELYEQEPVEHAFDQAGLDKEKYYFTVVSKKSKMHMDPFRSLREHKVCFDKRIKSVCFTKKRDKEEDVSVSFELKSNERAATNTDMASRYERVSYLIDRFCREHRINLYKYGDVVDENISVKVENKEVNDLSVMLGDLVGKNEIHCLVEITLNENNE